MNGTTTDVVVVGAGVIGCALARELASVALKVTVIERDTPGSGASGAGAGILAAQTDANEPNPLLDLCLESRSMFPRLVDELRSETGIDVHYRTTGSLFLALDDEEEAKLEKRFAWQDAAGLPVERLSAGRVATLEPSLAKVRIALRYPYDHHLDNVILTRALAASAAQRGVSFLTGQEATRIVAERGRVRGVVLGGKNLAAPHVVICAGAWSGLMETGGPKIPVVPVRGQMLCLEHPDAGLDHVIVSQRGYIVPRLDGRILVGSTMEHAGFEAKATAKGLGSLLTIARTLAPALEQATVTGFWAGLRPASSDGLPVLGPAGAPWPEGLHFATGHFRNGVLLAPVTARLLAQSIVSGKTSIPLDPFSPSRFLV